MFYFIAFSVTIIIFLSTLFLKYFKNFDFSPFFSKFWAKKQKKNQQIDLQRTNIPSPIEERQLNLENVENAEIKRTYEKELFKLGVGSFQITSHFYSNIFSKNTSPNLTKIKRLTNEMKQMSNFLPIYYSNAIFVRYDESKMDVMKAMIMGAEDTPYAHGAFLFDIYFEDTYPTTPPKVNLMTTGGNKLRFNPNLYINGYVCLSLLGTWSGGKGEIWSKDSSNLLQVLLSIQSLVMTEGIIFNEPSYNLARSNAVYKKQDVGYCNIVRYGTVKYAMNDVLQQAPAGFEDVIQKHFYYKKNEILKTCQKWLDEAQNSKETAEYTGLVVSHNYEIANLFTKNKDAYYNELAKEIEILRINLNCLNI